MACIPLKISGAGKYFTETKKLHTSESLDINYQYVTGNTQLDQNNSKLDMGQLQNYKDCGATHVVTTVVHGARAMTSFETEAKELTENKDIEGSLNVSLKLALLEITGDAKVKVTEKDREVFDKAKITFHGDVAPPSGWTQKDMLQYFSGLNSVV